QRHTGVSSPMLLSHCFLTRSHSLLNPPFPHRPSPLSPSLSSMHVSLLSSPPLPPPPPSPGVQFLRALLQRPLPARPLAPPTAAGAAAVPPAAAGLSAPPRPHAAAPATPITAAKPRLFSAAAAFAAAAAAGGRRHGHEHGHGSEHSAARTALAAHPGSCHSRQKSHRLRARPRPHP
ncbi:unnamed protein product, partial [Closterium sp. NIES-53]